jgi:hypothetical protein
MRQIIFTWVRAALIEAADRCGQAFCLRALRQASCWKVARDRAEEALPSALRANRIPELPERQWTPRWSFREGHAWRTPTRFYALAGAAETPPDSKSLLMKCWGKLLGGRPTVDFTIGGRETASSSAASCASLENEELRLFFLHPCRIGWRTIKQTGG